jgi:hypothetical protein
MFFPPRKLDFLLKMNYNVESELTAVKNKNFLLTVMQPDCFLVSWSHLNGIFFFCQEVKNVD